MQYVSSIVDHNAALAEEARQLAKENVDKSFDLKQRLGVGMRPVQKHRSPIAELMREIENNSRSVPKQESQQARDHTGSGQFSAHRQ